MRRMLACYAFFPVSSLLWLRSRDVTLRFHARQSFALGVWYVAALIGLSVADAGIGMVNRAAGQWVHDASVLVGAGMFVVWGYCFWRIATQKACVLPIIGRWAAKV